MPVNLRIFVWYFKIFIPRQHSQKCHFCRCRCRFAVLSIFCRCRLTWYILCQAIPYGHCIIIPLSCPQNLSHDAVLVFIYFIKEVFFIRCHHAHFLGRTRTRARALPQPLPAGRIMVILQYNIAYCIIKGEREKTRATCHYSTASWPVAHQSFCCVTSSACTR